MTSLARHGAYTKTPTEVIVIESDSDSDSDSQQRAGWGDADGDVVSIYDEGKGDEAYVVNQDSGSNASPGKSPWGPVEEEHVDIDEEDPEDAAQLRLEAGADKERVVKHPKTTDQSNTQLDFGEIESTYKHLLAFNSAQAGKTRRQENQEESRAPVIGVGAVRVDHAPRCDIECRTKGATLLAESEDEDELDLDFGSDDYGAPSDTEESPRNQGTAVKEPGGQRRQRWKLGRNDSATKEVEELFFRKEYAVGGYIVEELVRKPHLGKGKRKRKPS